MEIRNGSNVNFCISQATSCNTLNTDFPEIGIDDSQKDNLSVPGSQYFPRKLSDNSLAGVLNIFSNQLKYEEVLKSFTKLRIYFTVLCVINVFVVISAGICFGILFLGVNLNKKTNELLPAPSTVNIKCALLKAKLRWKKPNVSGNCSINDLMDALVEFNKPEKRILHMTKGVPVESNGPRSEHDITGWEIPGLNRNIQVAQNSFGYNTRRGVIIIPKDGFYFVYSSLTFGLAVPGNVFAENPRLINTDILHVLRRKQLGYSKFENLTITSMKCSNHTFVHNTHIKGLFYLRGGDELKVVISHAGYLLFDNEYKTENSFGIFLL